MTARRTLIVPEMAPSGEGGNSAANPLTAPNGPDRAREDAAMAEDPDLDTAAWEGTEADDAVGLVDPRHEIPNPPGM